MLNGATLFFSLPPVEVGQLVELSQKKYVFVSLPQA
jgi:hypothetical protein